MKRRYLLIISLPFLLGLSLVERFFSMPSGSMYPLLEKGEFLYVSNYVKGEYTINRGDVVLFYSPQDGKTLYLKRIVGVGGDIVQINGSLVALNDSILKRENVGLIEYSGKKYEKYKESIGNKSYHIVIEHEFRGTLPSGRYKIPKDHFFVLGDNRANSLDSRFIGFIPEKTIVGIYNE